MWNITKLTPFFSTKQLFKLKNHKAIWKNCMFCKKKFDAQTYLFKKKTKIIYPYIKQTCCRKCTSHWGGTKNKKIFRSYICLYCKEKFIPHKSKPHQNFCNRLCYHKYQKGKPNIKVRVYHLQHKIIPPHNSISYQEKQWLASFPNITHKQYKINITNKTYIVDGYDKNTNTVYEFLGSFWHGNPKIYNQSLENPVCKITFGELYQLTQKRLKQLKKAGFNVITKWSKR